MDPITTASLIISGISALASVVQAWKAGRELSESYIEETLESSSSSSSASLEELSTLTPSASAHAIAVIDPSLLDVMLFNVEKERENLKDALIDEANSNQERNRAVKIASSRICGELKRIKDLNAGVLPTEELKQMAVSFGCSD